MSGAPDTSRCAKLTAAILSGGLGTRLRTAVSDRPKVMVEVQGRPFLTYLLDQLEQSGFRHVVICSGYLAEQIRDTLGLRYGGLELSYSPEDGPLGTGGALRLALPLLRSDPVLVMNGDSYCGISLREFCEWHAGRKAEISIGAVLVSDRRRYGSLEIAGDGAVLRFREKEASGEGRKPEPGWISAGIYLLSRRMLESIPEGRPCSIETEIFPGWVSRGLCAYRVEAPFLDIGTPESYAAAEAFFQRRVPQPERS